MCGRLLAISHNSKKKIISLFRYNFNELTLLHTLYFFSKFFRQIFILILNNNYEY